MAAFLQKLNLKPIKLVSLVMVMLVGMMMRGEGQSPNGTLNFGNLTDGTTATTTNTGFGGVRVGNGGGTITLSNPGQEIGTQGELKLIAPTTGSINSVGVTSTEYGTAATTFTISFEVYLSGGSSGIMYFFAGNGTSFGSAQSNGFTGAQVFSGIQWNYGASNTIVTNNRLAGAWVTTGLTGTPFAQNTSYTVTIVGNNTAATVSNYDGNSNSVAANTYDLWVNGVLVGDDLGKALLPATTAINAFRFYGESSTSNVATLNIDNIRWWNTCVAPSMSTYSALGTIPTGNYTDLNINSGNGTLSGATKVNRITTLNSGTLTIGSNTLTINGTITYGTGTITGSNTSNLTIGGTSLNQTLNFTTGTTNNFLKNLTISSGATTTLGNALNITGGTAANTEGVVTLNGTGTQLTTGGFLTLKSNSFGTSRVAQSTGTVSGNVTVERYIPANTTNPHTGKAWRLLTVPVTGATINDSWQEGSLWDGVTALPSTGFGTLITGTQQNNAVNANGNGFDFWGAIANANSSIRYHSGTGTGAWLIPSTILGKKFEDVFVTNANQGFLMYIRGDRSISTQTLGINTTLRATGTLKQGTFSSIPVAANASSTYTLIGNPYASPVDFDKIYLANTAVILPVFTIWDANLNVTGGYRLITRTGTNTYTVNPQGSVDITKVQYIQSGQAIFMQGTAAGGNLSIQESHKATNGSDLGFLKVTAPIPALNIDLSIKNADSSLLLADGAVIRFSKKYTKPVTIEDVKKAFNFAENLAVAEDTFRLISDSRPLPARKDTVYLKLWGTGVKNYQFAINATAFTAPGLTAQLKDKYLNTSTPLTLDGSITTVNFSVTTDSASKAIDRFYIVFRKTAALTASSPDELITSGNGMKVYPNPVTNGKFTVSMNNLAKGSYEIAVFNTGGQKILSHKIEHPGGAISENIILANRSNGMYNVRLSNANGVVIKTTPVIINR